MPKSDLPDWEKVLSAAAHLQSIFPGTVLVGGTAAALYAEHRHSRDADHVMSDLRERFDAILEALQSVAGWKLARVNRPVLILGSLDGIETGVRQLIRDAPLDTVTAEFHGLTLTLPTPAEMLRIKAALILRRNATRDYLDFAALATHLGDVAAADAFTRFDGLYPQPNQQSAVQQLAIQLANPMPFDLDETNLREYKNLAPQWHDWSRVKGACASAATSIFDRLCG